MTKIKCVGHLLHKSVGHKICLTLWDKSVGQIKSQSNTVETYFNGFLVKFQVKKWYKNFEIGQLGKNLG